MGLYTEQQKNNLAVKSGAVIDFEAGSALKISGVAVTSDAAELNKMDGVTASTAELNEYSLSLDIADLSAEAVYYLVCPHAGDITKIYTAIDSAVLTANATITPAIGVTAVTNGVVTITQAGSAAGDVDVASPSAANTVTAGQAVNFTVTGAGAAGTGPRCHLVMVIAR